MDVRHVQLDVIGIPLYDFGPVAKTRSEHNAQADCSPVSLALLSKMLEPPARGCAGGCWLCDPFWEEFYAYTADLDLPEVDFLG